MTAGFRFTRSIRGLSVLSPSQTENVLPALSASDLLSHESNHSPVSREVPCNMGHAASELRSCRDRRRCVYLGMHPPAAKPPESCWCDFGNTDNRAPTKNQNCQVPSKQKHAGGPFGCPSGRSSPCQAAMASSYKLRQRRATKHFQ